MTIVAPPETLPQLVTRLREAKWASRREADRATGIPYATWQNIEVRGTIPTLATLIRVAEKLGVPDRLLINAARVSEAARAQAKSAPPVEEDKRLVAPPCVVVHRTKTAGYQVIYESARRRRIVRGRRLSYADALRLAATVANIHGCQIRGEQ